ncbi:MAG: hypothetical protein ACJ79R_23025 [Anaeromyxobacteraceae bacterium]
MRDATAYQEFLSDFLARKVEMFGHVAVTRAREIRGLEFDAQNRVLALGEDPFATVEAVLHSFERLTGRASNVTAHASLRALNLVARYPGLELPSM